jgi:hypothetical protein
MIEGRPLSERVALMALGCALAVSVGACGGTTLMNQRVEAKAKDWTIAVTEVSDGPNRYNMGGNVTYVPADNERFLWISMTVRNDRAAAQTFTYDRCGIDFDSREVLPSIVDRAWVILSEIYDKQDDMKPGEVVSRRLVFSYPDDRYPTRLACGEATMPLTLKR